MRRNNIRCTREDKAKIARASPFLPCVSCDLRAMLAQVRSDKVPDAQGQVSILFMVQDSLASILHGETKTEILIHRLLNTPETPPIVFMHILTHEMLHLVIPPREIDGKVNKHPPEFFEREKVLVPDVEQSWNWIWTNFWDCLKSDKKRERLMVKREWKQAMFMPRIPLEKCIVLDKQLRKKADNSEL